MRGNNENAEKDITAVATDGDVVVVCDDACVSSSCQHSDWIVDWGASYHITPYHDMFASYTGGSFGKVRMANHGMTEVAGIGYIHLPGTGCKLVLKDVRHVPDIRLNIISTGKLDDDDQVPDDAKEKPESNSEVPVNFDPVSSPMVQDYGERYPTGARRFELDLKQEKYVLYCDSQSTIHLSENSSFHSRTKHIDVRYHWIREALDRKLMRLEKGHTDENGADMITKSLPRDKLEICKREAGLVESPHEDEGENC
ncbi:hypothetical protein SASPL_137900 [Salvia splendens]|uniref:Retrovirus-related Pol polyprotein from transposon TNT 1-94-like beta-barrel domain-containing protein n=1 Tax=Salvia splendens TaxID=180675 RepID=A0A8X8WSJ5_SALSN|nr:hypothetical protein SASPL_137900 [Salvia splendens]